MRCDKCDGEITVYDLYPRSYRLYIYLCTDCKTGFLAHHFDTNLEIYQMRDVSMKRSKSLIFIMGLDVEPRVFDFKLKREHESIIVADEKEALGELAKEKEYIFTPYSEKATRKLCRILGCGQTDDISFLKDLIVKELEESK